MRIHRMTSLLACVMFAGQAGAQLLPVQASPTVIYDNMGTPATNYFVTDQFEKLDALVENIQKARARTVDGRYQLFMVTAEITKWLQAKTDPSLDESMDKKFAAWRKQFPSSPLEPIIESIEMNQRAWRARGSGYASQVTEEGWALFRERNEVAWKTLTAGKKQSAHLPAWYSYAIYLANDQQRDGDEIRALFDEGIARHPGYHQIYFAYLVLLTPKWGGSPGATDTFIREQASGESADAEVLYARLYWYADQVDHESGDIFRSTHLNWPRMRKGLEKILSDFPFSEWNYANFAMFACRARDGDTYGKLRPKVSFAEFSKGAPTGITIEVCDRRFAKL
jgi:hypothetical protein